MSDLALRPKLASAPEQAELNAKWIFGGKESGGAPFGHVPKLPKIISGGIQLSREWADYSDQQMGIATPYLLYEWNCPFIRTINSLIVYTVFYSGGIF